MDIALVIDRLLPAANYSGSLTDNTETVFNALTWDDERTKPSWQDILDEWEVYQDEQSNIKYYKIYDLLENNSPFKNVDKSRLPVDIDFKTGLTVDLYKEVVMSGGAPVYKQYYTDADIDSNGAVTYSNPIVKLEYEFERDSISLAKSCTQKMYWYDTNGDISTEYKTIKEFYNTSDSIAEAELRRSNIISDLKVKTIGLLMYTEQISQADAAELGRPFLAAYKVEIYNYIDEANTSFAAAITNSPIETYPWIDNMTPYGVTIRQFILNAIA